MFYHVLMLILACPLEGEKGRGGDPDFPCRMTMYYRAVYRFGCGAVVSSSWWNSCIFWVKIKYEFGGTHLQQLIKERLHLI